MNRKPEEIAAEAFLLGFMISREGFNAEDTFEHCCDGMVPSHQTETEYRKAMEANETFQECLSEALERVLSDTPYEIIDSIDSSGDE